MPTREDQVERAVKSIENLLLELNKKGLLGKVSTELGKSKKLQQNEISFKGSVKKADAKKTDAKKADAKSGAKKADAKKADAKKADAKSGAKKADAKPIDATIADMKQALEYKKIEIPKSFNKNDLILLIRRHNLVRVAEQNKVDRTK